VEEQPTLAKEVPAIVDQVHEVDVVQCSDIQSFASKLKAAWLRTNLASFQKLLLVGIETNPGPRRSGKSQKPGSKPRKGEKTVTFTPSSDVVMERPLSFGKALTHYKTVRTATYSNVTTSNVSFTGRGISFSLADLPNASEFTTLFDQYKIDKIEVLMIPSVTQSTAASPMSGLTVTEVDYDDANTPASLDEMYQSENHQLHTPTSSIARSFVPSIAIAAYSGAFTSYAQKTGWIDCASSNVAHYGFKIGCGICSSAYTYTINARLHLSFRGTR